MIRGFQFAIRRCPTENVRPSGGRDRRDFMNRIIDVIEKEQQKTDAAHFAVGDSVRVHTRVVEGDKQRIHIFAGIVIGRKGRGLNETFTVRRIVQGEGVERVFPLLSPRIAKIDVKKTGTVRRAKLYYLRKRVGKATRLKERKKGEAETTSRAQKAEQKAAK